MKPTLFGNEVVREHRENAENGIRSHLSVATSQGFGRAIPAGLGDYDRAVYGGSRRSGIPAALTSLLPPIVFRMAPAEIGKYILMAALVAPVIHVLFSFFLGWKEYMPFIPVPSLGELFR